MSVMMSGRPPHHLSSAAHHPPARPPSLLSPIDSSSSALFVGEILSTLNNGPSCSRALSRGGSIVGHREVMSVCLCVVLTVSGARVPLQILFLDLRVHSNTVFAPRILSSEFPNLKLGQIYPENLIVEFSNYVYRVLKNTPIFILFIFISNAIFFQFHLLFLLLFLSILN